MLEGELTNGGKIVVLTLTCSNCIQMFHDSRFLDLWLDMFAGISRKCAGNSWDCSGNCRNSAGSFQNNSSRTCSCVFYAIVHLEGENVNHVGTFSYLGASRSLLALP